MNRNLVLFFLSLAILFITGSYDLNYFNYKGPITYSDWEKITWNDFKGRKRPYVTLDGEDEFAFISTQIKATHTEEGNFKIETYFHPSRSYVYNQNIMDKALLRHELYHLHITEAVARRMRQELSTIPEYKDFQLSSCFLKYQQKEDSLQRAYDFETYHGYLLNKQKMWQKKVDSSLLALEKFSNPVVIIK